jgi:hypothetical protein
MASAIVSSAAFVVLIVCDTLTVDRREVTIEQDDGGRERRAPSDCLSRLVICVAKIVSNAGATMKWPLVTRLLG